MARLCVASCFPGESELVVSMLRAHDIPATVVNSGMYASLPQEVWVDEEDAVEARDLIDALRGGQEGTAPPEAEGGDAVDLRVRRRQRVGAAILIGCFLGFGTAHMIVARSWRGLALAALQIAGIAIGLRAEGHVGVTLVALAIALDIAGAIALVVRQDRVQLPNARARR